MTEKRVEKKKIMEQGFSLSVTERVLRIVITTVCVIAVVFAVIAVAVGAGAAILWNDAVDYINETVIPNSHFSLGPKTQEAQTSTVWVRNKETGEYEAHQQIDATVNRVWVEYKDIPKDIINAAVAIEDKRFFEHDGVDWKRTLAACANMFLGGSTYGGSTITQQVIKNKTQEDEVTVRRKLSEIFRALELENHCSKEEILEWYMNLIYLGEGCTGIQSASRVYFGKDVGELTTKECACLIGITNNPSMYDPYLHPVANERRTRIILEQMLDQEKITPEQYQLALEQTLVFRNNSDEDLVTCTLCKYTADRRDFKAKDGSVCCPACSAEDIVIPEKPAPAAPENPAESPAVEPDPENPAQDPAETEPEEPAEQKTSIDGNTGNGGYYTYFEDQVIRDVISALQEEFGYDYSTAAGLVTSGGLQIWSTVDPELQALVDEIYADLDNIPATYSSHQMQSAIIVIDNETGDIVAMRGGVGEKTGSLVLNRATQSVRPLGSAIKPLTVYAPAIEYGCVTPATCVEDSPFREENGRGWPLNDSRYYSGWMLLTSGISRSINTVAVKTLDKVTPRRSFDFATEKLGMTSMIESMEINGNIYTDVDYSPLALGQLTYGVTLRETASAFATFPNAGVYREARTFVKVLDVEGNVLLDNTQESHRAMSERTAWYINYLLQNAVTSGTGTPAYFGATAVAGKTGTTTDDKDRWFVGYTSRYTAAVWCGFDTPEEINLVKNKNPACVLFKKVMEKIYKTKGYSYEEFFTPADDVEWVELCSESGLLPCSSCKNTTWVKLFRSDIPKETCDNLTQVTVATCVSRIGDEASKSYVTRENLPNDNCRAFYELTHSADYILLVKAGKLKSVDAENTIGSVKQRVHARNAGTGEKAREELYDAACEACGLKDCPYHTADSVRALKKAIEKAKSEAGWVPEPVPPEFGPTVTEPAVTEITETEPPETAPPVTEPPETTPPETQPPETETVPPETEPVPPETEPTDPVPPETEPVPPDADTP